MSPSHNSPDSSLRSVRVEEAVMGPMFLTFIYLLAETIFNQEFFSFE